MTVESEIELQTTDDMVNSPAYKGLCSQPQMCQGLKIRGKLTSNLGPWCPPSQMKELKQTTLLLCLQFMMSMKQTVFALAPATLLIESLLFASPTGVPNAMPFSIPKGHLFLSRPDE